MLGAQSAYYHKAKLNRHASGASQLATNSGNPPVSARKILQTRIIRLGAPAQDPVHSATKWALNFQISSLANQSFAKTSR